jgi:glycosyltransferase involved in cell wall biosynthesis
MRRHLELLVCMQTRLGLSVRVAAPSNAGWERFEPLSLSSQPHPLKDLRAAVQIKRLAKESDLVHAHGFRAAWVASLALRRRNSPLLFTAHNLPPDNPGTLAQKLLRLTFQQADAVICVSDFVRLALAENGFPANKLFVIYNAVDIERFQPDAINGAEFRRSINVEPGIPLLGIVGRIVPWKGHMDLIKAFQLIRNQMPDAALAVVGEEDPAQAKSDSWVARLKRKAADVKIGDSIIWAGWREDVRTVFAGLDLVCMPSYREPFGLSAIEAMAMGKPVVAYRSGALPELITHGDNGFLTEEGKIQAFQECIVTLLKSADMRHRIGESARQSVLARFHPQRQAEEVLKLYETCLQIRGG